MAYLVWYAVDIHTQMVSTASLDTRDLFIWISIVIALGMLCLFLLFLQFRQVTDNVNKRLEREHRAAQRVKQSLVESTNLNNRLLETVRSIVIGVDIHDTVNYWNRSARQHFGLEKNDVLGRPILNIGINWDWPSICEKILDCVTSEVYSNRFEVEYFDANKNKCFLSLSIAPVLPDNDQRDGYLIIADDITDQKNKLVIQQRLEKLQSIERMAAGIAHEINTPVQYLTDNAYFLQQSFDDFKDLIVESQLQINTLTPESNTDLFKKEFRKTYDEYDIDYLIKDMPKALEQSIEGLAQISTIINAMQYFSTPLSSVKKLTDINNAITQTITVTRHTWKAVSNVNTDYDPDMGEIPCYSAAFNEAIFNLIENAAHAIKCKNSQNNVQGTIDIITRRNEQYAEIRIIDNGNGIEDTIKEQIFDPFFTTKEVGQGAGQGLCICRNIIVEQHGGELEFETQAGVGTSFVIRLPIDPIPGVIPDTP